MQTTVEHQTLGTIVYDENAWTGAKQITINGFPLTKKDKKTFVYNDGEQVKTLTVKGAMVTGVTLLLDGEEIPVVPKPSALEITLTVIAFAIIFIWGNVPALCAILPLVGGAIGGAIVGGAAVLNLTLMRKVESVGKKLLICLGLFAATFLICLTLGCLFVAALIL